MVSERYRPGGSENSGTPKRPRAAPVYFILVLRTFRLFVVSDPITKIVCFVSLSLDFICSNAISNVIYSKTLVNVNNNRKMTVKQLVHTLFFWSLLGKLRKATINFVMVLRSRRTTLLPHE